MRLAEEEKTVWIVAAGVMDPQHAEMMPLDLIKWVSDGCIIEA
ncbi:hypothetical protein [Bacillus pumilus]|nr:hypothetical protein [Bacillus pumilus]